MVARTSGTRLTDFPVVKKDLASGSPADEIVGVAALTASSWQETGREDHSVRYRL